MPAPSNSRETAPKTDIVRRRSDPETPGAIKIALPAHVRIQLHTIKLLTGVSIADTVERALGEYFERLKSEQASRSGTADVAEPSLASPAPPRARTALG